MLALFLIFRNNGYLFRSAPGASDLMQYFVVMIDYGRRGREAIVDPEVTRREVISRIVSGEYRNISFIHEVAGSGVDDVTEEIIAEAALPALTDEGADEVRLSGADWQAAQFDRARDLAKHES